MKARIFAAVLASLMMLSALALVPVRADKSGDFEYKIIGGGATITKYTGSASKLTIPDTLGGKPVKELGEWSFSMSETLTSVTIPKSVTVIANSAFFECSKLTRITIPAGVKTIGANAFWNCSSLTGIDVDSKNKEYKSIDGVLYDYDLTKLIVCPAGTKLTSIKVPDGVTEIDYSAFYFCISLKSVTIPDSVTKIGEFAFAYCLALESVKLPAGIKALASCSFSPCPKLTSIDIPAGVTEIGESAFAGCESLKSVTIPYTVKTVGAGAFSSCPSLNEVHYSGSESDWNRINISDQGNDDLKSAKVIYNQKEVTETATDSETDRHVDTTAHNTRSKDTDSDKGRTADDDFDHSLRTIFFVLTALAVAIFAAIIVLTVVIAKKKKNN